MNKAGLGKKCFPVPTAAGAANIQRYITGKPLLSRDWPSQVDPGSLSRIQTKLVLPDFTHGRNREEIKILVARSKVQRESTSRPANLLGSPQPVDPTAAGVLDPSLAPLAPLSTPDSGPGCPPPSSAASSAGVPEIRHAPRRHAISLDDAEADIEEEEEDDVTPWDFPWD